MEQFDLLRQALATLEQLNIAHMVVGSMASMFYGQARLTQDIDIVVDLKRDKVESVCAAFPAPDFYVSLPAAREAVDRGGQFNVIHPTSGNKIDFMIARRDAWGQAELARRQTVQLLPDLQGTVASPEDVILGKMRYYQEGEHEKHLRDIAAIVQLSADQLDYAYIEHWAFELSLSTIWQTIVERVGREK